MTPFRLRVAASLPIACLLLSCGGGSGGEGSGNTPPPPPPPPPPSSLAPLNENVAEPAAETSLYSAEDTYYAMLLLTQAAQDLQRNQLDPLPFSCSQGGTVALNANDLNGNALLDSGDRVVINYDACNGVASGRYMLRVEDAAFNSGVFTTLAGRFSIDLTYHTGAEPTLTAIGEMAFTAASDALTWLATDFRIDWIDRTFRESLIEARVEVIVDSTSEYSFAFAGTVESDAVGGSFDVATELPFRGQGGQWPRTGMLTAIGRDDSTIRYLADGGAEFATCEVDADADGVIDTVAHGIPWAGISTGIAFGIFGDPDVPAPPAGPDLIGRRIPLGGTAEDLAVNASRGHAYVTIPERHELLVLSVSTLEVVRRVYLASRPAGLSVSATGDEIFVGLAAAGAIAILDADSFAETRIFVAPELQSSTVYKVVETEPGILYVGTGIANSTGHIARVDRNAGTVTPIATTAFAKIELLADPSRNLLYASDGAQAAESNLRQLDASVPATPVLQSFAITSGREQMNRLSLSPSGNLIYAASGHVFDNVDLGYFGRITRGVPAASNNGAEALVASGGRDLVIHSSATLQELDRLETNCWAPPDPPNHGDLFGQVQRLAQSPVNGQWLLLGEEVLCAIDLLNPDTPPGTGEPGVLPQPLPTRVITATSVHWGDTMFDAAYDDQRGRLYVTLYSRRELVTVDAVNLVVMEREALGNMARGLAISPDGSTLAIMFHNNGHIAFKDLVSGVIETQDISSLLGSIAGYDVEWLDDDALIASASPPCCDKPPDYLVRVSRSDPGASRRIAGGAEGLIGDELTITPDRRYLYVNRGTHNELLKLDLTQPGEPIVDTYAPEGSEGSMYSLRGSNFSPDGDRFVMKNGQVRRTSDLLQTGEVTGQALFAFSVDGATILGRRGRQFDRYDAFTFQAFETLEPSANCQSPRQILPSADGRMLIAPAQSSACFWQLDQPVTQSLKPRPHDAYVCGPACMLRNWGTMPATEPQTGRRPRRM